MRNKNTKHNRVSFTTSLSHLLLSSSDGSADRLTNKAAANIGLKEMAGEVLNQSVVLSIKFCGRRTVSAFKPPLL